MAMTELTKQCLDLPRSERESLARLLKDSLDAEGRIDDGSRFSILYKAAKEVMNAPGTSILTQRKDYHLVFARRMIAYTMAKEGYSLQCIGKHLMRHHASVIHMRKCMEDVLYFRWKNEMKWWELFNEKVKEYEADNGADDSAQGLRSNLQGGSAKQDSEISRNQGSASDGRGDEEHLAEISQS